MTPAQIQRVRKSFATAVLNLNKVSVGTSSGSIRRAVPCSMAIRWRAASVFVARWLDWLAR
ncbi:MAG: hypothetical protein AAF637_16555 [Pseudomonadota bacterium]